MAARPHYSGQHTPPTGGERGAPPFQGSGPRHIIDFTKAMSIEIRTLLNEVGELRDERQRLQREIAELMAVKARHGTPGGDYSPEWMADFQRLAIEAPPGGAPPPPPEEPAPVQAARPGWRRVSKKPDVPSSAVVARRRAGKSPAAPPPPLPAEPPKPELPSWAQWKPNPTLAPTPRHGPPQALAAASPPPRSGLFGPSTPPPQ